MANLKGYLQEWMGSEVTVINPESFKSTALGKGLTFQSYKANVAQVDDDCIKLEFASSKGESQSNVTQIVPISWIKRMSVWGNEKLLHL